MGGPTSATVMGRLTSTTATGVFTSTTATGGPTSATASTWAKVNSEMTQTSNTLTDSLHRLHLKTLHTGPGIISVRTGENHSSISESNCRDLESVIDEVTKESLTVVTLIVDGGPDWSTK